MMHRASNCHGRFAILPLLGAGLLALALALHTVVTGDLGSAGLAILAGSVVVYIIVAVLLGRLTWLSPILFGTMLVTHAAAALVVGLALSAGDAQQHSILAAWQLGLWDFAPAPLLIAAFAVACAGLSAPTLKSRLA